MKKLLIISCMLLLLLAALAWVEGYKPPTPLKFIVPRNWPKPKYDFAKNPLTQEGFLLGRKLFYDLRLSVDSTVSCGSCHQQFAAFSTYEHNLSHGVNSSLTTRNAPALQNLAWQSNFMWDGSIPHLDLQPLMPLTAANEMGETPAFAFRPMKNRDARKVWIFTSAHL